MVSPMYRFCGEVCSINGCQNSGDLLKLKRLRRTQERKPSPRLLRGEDFRDKSNEDVLSFRDFSQYSSSLKKKSSLVG